VLQVVSLADTISPFGVATGVNTHSLAPIDPESFAGLGVISHFFLTIVREDSITMNREMEHGKEQHHYERLFQKLPEQRACGGASLLLLS
jgi:hypothetical protein